MTIYDIVYDQYYPDAPTQITLLDKSKHQNESMEDIIKNITGKKPVSYKIKI